jgi:D-sedoheptulose 7-phosphate isomerase
MEEMKKNILELLNLANNVLNEDLLMQTIQKAADIITDAYRSGNKVVFCGNGGSAAEAQHLAAELSGRFKIDRRPLPAEACHVNSSFITAVSNDFSFSKAYARYIEGFCQKGDILFGLSTSGNSENIASAFQKAAEMGMNSIALTGKTGGRLAGHADLLINVPSTNVPRIQEMHLLIGHIICETVEKELFGNQEQD